MFNLFKKAQSNASTTPSVEAQVYAQGVLSEIGVIEALGFLHQQCLSGSSDHAEIRGVVIGGFRTVGLGAALTARYLQVRDIPKEQVGEAFYNFVNNSSIRHIASEFGLKALPEDQVYLGIVNQEKRLLLQKGYEIGNYHETGDFGQAFETWRDVMKMDVGTD